MNNEVSEMKKLEGDNLYCPDCGTRTSMDSYSWYCPKCTGRAPTWNSSDGVEHIKPWGTGSAS